MPRPVPSRPRAWLPLVGAVQLAAAVAGAGVLAMAGITGLDVVLRLFGRPLVGAYDLVRVAGAITLACALPLTTAVKGHVAIEFFFHRLGRAGRLVVDACMRLLQAGAFAVAAWQCVRHGQKLLQSGEVTPTLQLPVFWVPWVLAAGCGLTVAVTLFHLFRPDRELIHP